MPVGSAIVDWAGKIPMLLKADGSQYSGVTYVRSLVPGYDRRFPEITQMANNDMGFANVGQKKGYVGPFQIECWSVGAMQGIKNDIAKDDTEGKFVLEIPALEGGGVDRLTIRFFEAEFSRTYPRRAGFPEVFTADIEIAEVL